MNGAAPSTANGAPVNGVAAAPPKLIKRKKPASSLFKSTNNRQQNTFVSKTLKPPEKFNKFVLPETDENGRPVTPQPVEAAPQPPKPVTKKLDLSHLLRGVPAEELYSGFSDPSLSQPGKTYQDFKLVISKRDLMGMDGPRFHMMQVRQGPNIDVRKATDFPRPVTLQRRSVAAELAPQSETKQEDVKNELDPDQKADLATRKEQRAREREANLAQIAPSQTAAKKMNNFKGTQQVFHRRDFTEEEKRIVKTNYEEVLPWVLESTVDSTPDGKMAFIGQNQIGAFGMHVGFSFERAKDGNGRFRLVPLEKVYTFKPKPKINNNMSIEDIEKAMKRGAVDPSWLTELQHKRSKLIKEENEAKQAKGLFTGSNKVAEFHRNQRRGEDADLDFEDDFADDEEGNLFGSDEDEGDKDAKTRVKEEQLQANFLGFRDEQEDDKDEERDQREEAARKALSKRYRKALEKREGNYNHGSDSESDSSSETDEDEKKKLEEEKAKEVKKEEDGQDAKSGLSSGANTPSSRKEKRGSGWEDGPRKSKKRPGSPNLSDASGTDASTIRKKKRKSHHPPSTQGTPGPSRPTSPDNLDPLSATTRNPRASFTSNAGGAGAGSDSEAGAMSDGARNNRLTLKLTAKQPTSRSASPAPAAPRPTSPETTTEVTLPSIEQIAAKIPPEGMPSKAMFPMFPSMRKAMLDANLKTEVLRRLKLAGKSVGKMIYPHGAVVPAQVNSLAVGGGDAGVGGAASGSVSG